MPFYYISLPVGKRCMVTVIVIIPITLNIIENENISCDYNDDLKTNKFHQATSKSIRCIDLFKFSTRHKEKESITKLQVTPYWAPIEQHSSHLNELKIVDASSIVINIYWSIFYFSHPLTWHNNKSLMLVNETLQTDICEPYIDFFWSL